MIYLRPGRSPPKNAKESSRAKLGMFGRGSRSSPCERTLPSLQLLISFKEPAGVLGWYGAPGNVIRDQTAPPPM